jgi:tetratricopeptide (TPR) repeat protein
MASRCAGRSGRSARGHADSGGHADSRSARHTAALRLRRRLRQRAPLDGPGDTETSSEALQGPTVAPPDIPDPTGEIRLAPTGTSMSADQIQLSIADGFYAKQMFVNAAPEYEKYLGLFANAADRPVALFRLAESYRRNGTMNAAKNSYETLLNQFANGEFIGPAAYRLADIYYQEHNYNFALPMFRKASVKLREPKLANMAKFYTGRTLENLGQKIDARMVYEDLVRDAERESIHRLRAGFRSRFCSRTRPHRGGAETSPDARQSHGERRPESRSHGPFRSLAA